jgi:predicted lipoprotein with Yx(FWY)xxD motif
MSKRQPARVAVARPAPLPLRLAFIALVAALALLAIRAASAAPAGGTVVRVAKSGLGRMLVDSRGRTLYLFEADRNGKSACSGACVSFWPPLLTSGKPRAGTGVAARLLGTIKRRDGGVQVTYAGHPLYTFRLDTRSGQTKGEGLNDFGGHWYAVGAKGRKLVKHATAASGGYGGYGGR